MGQDAERVARDFVQLSDELAATVTDYRSPKVIARVNDQYVKIARLKGEFVWHAQMPRMSCSR